MKLLRNTKSKITKDENGENVPYLEITEVAITILLMYSSITVVLIIVINKIQDSCIHLFQINGLVNYEIFRGSFLYFHKLLTQNFCLLKCGLQIKILIL